MRQSQKIVIKFDIIKDITTLDKYSFPGVLSPWLKLKVYVASKGKKGEYDILSYIWNLNWITEKR